MRRLLLLVLVVLAGLTSVVSPANATPTDLLAKVVVIGVPGLTWSDVQASPELTALVSESHVGSISVKTAAPHACPIDGWLTISAGTRAWGNLPDQPCTDLPKVVNGKIDGWQTYRDRQTEHHTSAPLGRLGDNSERLCGFGPGAAIAVARQDGTLRHWRPELDLTELSSTTCRDAVIDAGAMPLREGREEARKRVADLVRQVVKLDDSVWVLLAGVSQEIANAKPQALVAMQLPPDDIPRWLTSRSTRRPGLIQLTDLTATILRGDADTPLDGSEIHFTGDHHTDAAAVIEDRLDTNERFSQPRPVLIAVGITFVLVHLLVLGLFALTRSRSPLVRTVFTYTTLSQAGFFAAVFLSTLTSWWRWPSPGFSLYCVVLGLSALVGVASKLLLRKYAYLGIALLVYLILLVDGVLGTPLQYGSMFTDGPLIGGRFYGFGNSTFATLAVAAIVTAALVGQWIMDDVDRKFAAVAVLLVGGAAIVVDGKPGWGTDFGGIIALTPAVLLLAWLTWRGSISWRALLGVGVAGLLAVSAVAYLDYLRPADERSHFGAFVARLLDDDVADVLTRKLQMSLGFFDSVGGWAMLLAVILAMLGTILPDRVPFAAYRAFYTSRPMVRPALLALSTCGLVGMLLNDSGVTLPAIMTGFALPLLVARLVEDPPSISTPEVK